MQSSSSQHGQRVKRTRAVDEGDNQEWNKQRKRSKRSRLSKDAKEGFGQPPAGGDEDAVGSTLIATAEKKQKKPKQLQGPSGWSLSRAGGGRFTDMDPIFTPDGQYIILGLETAVHVFSLSTSRLIRVLETKKRHHVTSYKLSRCDPSHLYISTHSGNISKWDWSSGRRIRSWETSNHTFDLDIGLHEVGDSPRDIVLSLHKHGNGQRAISLTIPDHNSGSRHLDGNVVLETTSSIEAVRSAENGRVLVVRAGGKLLIGTTTSQPDDRGFASADYTWREISLPSIATCFDIRERNQISSSTPRPPLTGAQSSIVDIVVGESQGSVLIYSDILNTLDRIEDARENDTKEGLVSSRLHWHRNAVKTVRWSVDGNYIISGGLETVLVLWQLDTGRKQFLPHLSSPICNITVSPTGDSYAVKLADNSVMVLSTAELKPLASINGLQLSSSLEPEGWKPLPKTPVSMSTIGNPMDPPRFPPAILHPLKPSRLLLAASTQLTSVETSPYNTLQTFDIATYHQVSRQALTRTNATVVNTAPDGSEITTPDIKQIGITKDGKWLSTVDEWMPRPQNIKPLHANDVEFEQGVDCLREVFLKFWEWNDVGGEWMLVTRIDAPHYEASMGSTHVLDLATNPGGTEFATVGCDGVVRLWSCGIRYRRDDKMRTTEDRQLKTWKCRNTVSLESSPAAGGVSSSRGYLSFSEDGSVLAVCWDKNSNKGARLVYLIDTQTCEVRHVRDGLCEGIPRAIGFLGRDLIVLSNRIVAWDTVDDKLRLNASLPEAAADASADKNRSLLSINSKSNTFAVAFTDYKSKNASRVRVFSALSHELLFETGLRDTIHSVLADPMSGDHVIIDAAAQVRRLGSSQATSTHAIPEISSLTPVLGNVFGKSLGDAPSSNVDESRKDLQGRVESSNDDGDEKLSTEKLSNVFDRASGFTLPVVSILFEDMMSLFKR